MGRSNSIVILPHHGRKQSLNNKSDNNDADSVLEELRTVLQDEAVSLDHTTQSIWRLQVDPLTVLNTLSKLGFVATHFDVNAADGVHTWTMTFSSSPTTARTIIDDANDDCGRSEKSSKSVSNDDDEISEDDEKSNRMQPQQFPTREGDDDDLDDTNNSRSLSTNTTSASTTTCMQIKASTRLNNLLSRKKPEEEAEKSCLVAENAKFLMPCELRLSGLSDFMAEIPDSVQHIYSDPKLTLREKRRHFCRCKPDGACRSAATAAGRRYCHFALDKAAFDDDEKTNFSTSRMVVALLNLLYRRNELCCISAKLGHVLPPCSHPMRDRGLVTLPVEHFYDMQHVLVEYWNAFVRSTEHALDQKFVQKTAPTAANIKHKMYRHISHTRYQLHVITAAGDNDDDDDDVGVDSNTETTPAAENLPTNPKKPKNLPNFLASPLETVPPETLQAYWPACPAPQPQFESIGGKRLKCVCVDTWENRSKKQMQKRQLDRRTPILPVCCR